MEATKKYIVVELTNGNLTDWYSFEDYNERRHFCEGFNSAVAAFELSWNFEDTKGFPRIEVVMEEDLPELEKAGRKALADNLREFFQRHQ